MAQIDLTQLPIVQALQAEDQLLAVAGNKLGRTTVNELKKNLQGSDMHLQQVAFYIDINEPADTSTNVNTGGNEGMRRMWEAQWRAGVLHPDGRWAPLSSKDGRVFADGTQAVGLDNNTVSGISNCDFMNIIPETWYYIQTVDVGEKTIDRLWISLMQLPGWKEPQQIVAAFKATEVGGQLRSLPNKVPTRSKTVRAFWLSAQARGKNYGLAGIFFRNSLLFYMMAKYGQRSSQTAKLPDGTVIWGPGLDGTGSESYLDQYPIVTGQTLHLGKRDGNAAVLDAKGATCHSVRVGEFENPYGQYFEVDGHMISHGLRVFAWRDNYMPSAAAPTPEDFEGIEYYEFTRHNATITSGERMNILKGENQGVFMIPEGTRSGISYGDRFSYAADGQLWLWGGRSNHGSKCGLAYPYSNIAWSHSYSYLGARLAYFGDIREVNGQDLVA